MWHTWHRVSLTRERMSVFLFSTCSRGFDCTSLVSVLSFLLSIGCGPFSLLPICVLPQLFESYSSAIYVVVTMEYLAKNSHLFTKQPSQAVFRHVTFISIVTSTSFYSFLVRNCFRGRRGYGNAGTDLISMWNNSTFIPKTCRWLYMHNIQEE